MRQSADHVEVERIQKSMLLGIQPGPGEPPMALRTVPVAAAFGHVFGVATVRANVEQVTEFTGAAARERPDRAAVVGTDRPRDRLQSAAQDLTENAVHRESEPIGSKGSARACTRPWFT